MNITNSFIDATLCCSLKVIRALHEELNLFEEKGIGFGGDRSLNIDLIAEKIFIKKLSEFGNILSEEAGFIDNGKDKKIVIDPIDGTTNFAHKVPHCCISVGVFENKKPKFAFVYNPILDEFFYAIKGEGAYKNNKKISVSTASNFQRALISTGFPYSGADNRDDLMWVVNRIKNILPACQDIRRFGSAALDLCYVAEGVIDGYYEINLKPWDVSAGMLILKEAGGVVSNLEGMEYDMFKDRCIVASNGYIHNELLSRPNIDK